MPDTIPNLWPEQFRIDVQSPLTILRVQASNLGKVTRGILEGDVETESNKEDVQHRLVVIAPALDGYRHTLLTAVHHPDFPYPVQIRAKALKEKVKLPYKPVEPTIGNLTLLNDTVYPTANSDDQMQELVAKALRSEQTMATILSLIAKSNEARAPNQGAESEKADGEHGQDAK